MRSILIILLLTICFAETSKAQMFDELKKEENDHNPDDKKGYLVLSTGIEYQRISYTKNDPANSILGTPLLNLYNGFTIPLKADYLFRCSRKFDIGPGIAFERLSTTQPDFSAPGFPNTTFTLNTLSYFIRGDYMITESIDRNFGVCAEIGSFSSLGSSSISTSAPLYFMLGADYNYKIKKNIQLLLEANYSIKTFSLDGGSGNAICFGLMANLRIAI